MKKKITLKYLLNNFDCVITCVTLFACVVLVNANVLLRYIFKSPLKWSNEVVTSLFVWTVFIGSAYAHRKHAHLGVDIVVNLFHGKTRDVIQFIVAVLEIAILVMLTVISAQYVYNLIVVRGKIKLSYTDYLRLPKWWTGIAVPIGFGLSTVYAVLDFLRDQLHILKPKAASDEEKVVDHEVTGGNF